MTARVTPLGRSLLTVAAWALVLAILSARPELFLVALPLLLALAALALGPRVPDYALTHEISRDRLFEGEAATVTVVVTAQSTIPLMELLEPLPAGSHLASAASSATAGGTRTRSVTR